MIDESMNLQMEYVNKKHEVISVYIVSDCASLVLNLSNLSKSYYINDWDDVTGEYAKLFESILYMNSADPCVLDTIGYIRESEEAHFIDWESIIKMIKEVL